MGRKKVTRLGENIENLNENSLARRLSGLISDAGELAKFLGCSTSAVNQYRAGTSRPSLENICRIAEYYHVTTDYLLGVPWGAKSFDADIQGAMAYTGLSESAIRTLHSCTGMFEPVGRTFLSAVIEFTNMGLLGRDLDRAESMKKDYISFLEKSGITKPTSPYHGTRIPTEITDDGRIVLENNQALHYTRSQIKDKLCETIDCVLDSYYKLWFNEIAKAEGGNDDAVNQKDGN